MLKDLNIATKLIIGFGITIAAVSIFGFVVVTQLDEISVISHEVEEATEISQAALDFNVENFHTQLEVWEYAYEPNQTRLRAFEKHNETLSVLLDKLVEAVEREDKERAEEGEITALIVGGDVKIKEIAFDLELVRKDWDYSLFPAIGRLQSAKERGLSEEDEEFRRFEIAARVAVTDNEDLFDELKFNSEVDKFVAAQEELVRDLEKRESAIIAGFKNILVIFIGFVFLISLLAGLWIFVSISPPIKKLSQVAKLIAAGDLSKRAEVTSRDEIGQLARAFNEMTAKLKESYGGLEKKVRDRTEELEKAETAMEEKNRELEGFNKIAINRETKMIELKKEIETLKKKYESR